ncbi:gamma-glutamyl-gamma-aminobutyrate hydrolase family protein [Longivirga aurantiaca]|jgi:putative glutamine amidotransferase|uniref:Gamma-glutamyl-gamma-aminobutyrate hydrolase family protein n=1 Tax=Longivirga aurantiaca TaxID=1837743 RepID=A0ABW1T4C9_9ACTN
MRLAPPRRPRVGITAEERRVDLSVLVEDCVVVAQQYAHAVWDAGGMPVILPVLTPDDADEIVAELDGLLLTGGGDVEPGIYGEQWHDATYGVVGERDAFEIALVRAVVRLQRPALGICRGLQLLNVAHGGTLDRHVSTDQIEHWQPGFAPAHAVTIAEGSRLGEIYGAGERLVNSFHHQAAQTLGERLCVTAVSTDGTIEALEATNVDSWLVGVQWHPERPWRKTSADLPLFEALVAEARRSRQDSHRDGTDDGRRTA